MDWQTRDKDPIFGLLEKYNLDPREKKYNYIIGVLQKNGVVQPFETVQYVDDNLDMNHYSRGYLPIHGNDQYLYHLKQFLELDQDVLSFQTLGSTGALSVLMKTAKRNGTCDICIGTPTWGNHLSLAMESGLNILRYKHTEVIDSPDQHINHALESTKNALVLVQPSAHNPTGSDWSVDQWLEFIHLIKKNHHTPIVDMAYHGLGKGFQEDTQAIKLLKENNIPFFLCYSCSKNFGLYSQRVGALFGIGYSRNQRSAIQSQVEYTIRTNYSNPPVHGSEIVRQILSNVDLRNQWLQEVNETRKMLDAIRIKFSNALYDVKPSLANLVKNQCGLFLYLNLSQDVVHSLRENQGIYMTKGGRINIGALDSEDIDYVSRSVLKVINEHHHA
jgi:aromatic-amino-acid transaminase